MSQSRAEGEVEGGVEVGPPAATSAGPQLTHVSTEPAVAHEAPTPAIPPRFPAFDGLRAIAAITVVAIHTSFSTGLTTSTPSVGIYTARLDIGVAVFFLISGFLLYRPFVVAHLAGASRPRTGAFWVRRLLRIVPAYWVALFVTANLMHAESMGPGGWRGYVVHYLFLQIYFRNQLLTGIGQAWSLCVEMTFYLFLPLYAMVVGRARAGRTPGQRLRVELAGIGVLVACSIAWKAYVFSKTAAHDAHYSMASIWLPAYLDLFALGMLLATASAWVHHRGREPRACASRWFPWVAWACAGGCFYAVAHLGVPLVPLYTETMRDLARQSLYGAFSFFLLLPAVFGPQDRGLVRGFLRCWPVAAVGTVSYGVYLWHQAWIHELMVLDHLTLFQVEFWWFFGAVLGLAIGTATLSYLIVEKPALRLKRSIGWWRDRGSRAEQSQNALPATR